MLLFECPFLKIKLLKITFVGLFFLGSSFFNFFFLGYLKHNLPIFFVLLDWPPFTDILLSHK